jgi:hypothetical protein
MFFNFCKAMNYLTNKRYLTYNLYVIALQKY